MSSEKETERTETKLVKGRPEAGERPRAIELLAPAKDKATAIAAIDHGADAVYMGGPGWGARKEAANSLDDLREVALYAHQFGVRLYVTLNTIVYEEELKEVEALAWDIYRAGADALIVQDMALLKMTIPPIALHASTQCDTRSPGKARFLQEAGFSQIVLARELSLGEISRVCREVDVPVEVFVHGALCVSFSGDCRASLLTTGRSANRGECCQVCRWPFDLEDAAGRKLLRDKHLLSLRDMNRLDRLGELLDVGVSSLKIEGRLKDTAYVKTVTAAYRQALDKIIDAHPEKYCRASRGRIMLEFQPDVSRAFNRGFTDYFLNEKAGKMATFASPKWIGKEIGTLKRQEGKSLVVSSFETLCNGDGLAFSAADGMFEGFRANRVENLGKATWRVFPARPVTIPSGTIIYRNSDKALDDKMAKHTSRRAIDVEMTLSAQEGTIELAIRELPDGRQQKATLNFEAQETTTPQLEARRRTLGKLGATIYNLEKLTDNAGNLFIPASILTDLRRRAVALLQQPLLSVTPMVNKTASHPSLPPELRTLDCRANIANSLSREFYDELGAEVTEMAAEVERPKKKENEVMETRYCLRRELGCCLKTREGKKLPTPLFLTSQGNRFRLDFNCHDCQMKIIKV